MKKKALIHKTPRRAADFDEILKFITLIFLKVFLARENEEVCSILFETIEKDYLFVEKHVFSINTMEIDDKSKQQKFFFGSNDDEFSFTRDEKELLNALSKKCSIGFNQKEENEKADVYDNLFLEMRK